MTRFILNDFMSHYLTDAPFFDIFEDFAVYNTTDIN